MKNLKNVLDAVLKALGTAKPEDAQVSYHLKLKGVQDPSQETGLDEYCLTLEGSDGSSVKLDCGEDLPVIAGVEFSEFDVKSLGRSSVKGLVVKAADWSATVAVRAKNFEGWPQEALDSDCVMVGYGPTKMLPGEMSKFAGDGNLIIASYANAHRWTDAQKSITKKGISAKTVQPEETFTLGAPTLEPSQVKGIVHELCDISLDADCTAIVEDIEKAVKVSAAMLDNDQVTSKTYTLALIEKTV